MKPKYILRIRTLLVCLLLLMSGSFMTVGQGIADSLRIVAVAQLVEDTIINHYCPINLLDSQLTSISI